jgi:hypothetical protein
VRKVEGREFARGDAQERKSRTQLISEGAEPDRPQSPPFPQDDLIKHKQIIDVFPPPETSETSTSTGVVVFCFSLSPTIP